MDDTFEFQKFEQFLIEISKSYINLPADKIEKVIRRDLGRLGRLLKADRCIIYLADKTNRSFKLDLPFVWWPDKDDEFIRGLDEAGIEAPVYPAIYPDIVNRFRYAFDKWFNGESLQFTHLDELPDEAKGMKEIYRPFGIKSFLSVPISVAGNVFSTLVINTTRIHRTWPEDLVKRIQLFGEVFSNALARKQSDEELRSAFSEIKKLKERIEADYIYLRDEIKIEQNFSGIVGKSKALKEILFKVKQVAPTNSTILLLGETGTGKGVIARAAHNAGRRKERPLIQVNCASIAHSLIESELFGYERGAFTGATSRRIGRFELARGTSLFLDEIGDLPFEMQSKLLRVIQDGEFERVGGSNTINTDARIIAATNRDLEKEVEEGRFRRDLWYRLNVFPIYIPPLRERMDDIPLFVSFFLDKYGKWIGKKFDMVSQKTIKALQSYTWPGNIRELENLIERSVITSPNGKLHIEIPAQPGIAINEMESLEKIERKHILHILDKTYWKINGSNGAAERLGLHPNTLRFRMNKLGIKRARAKS